MLQRIHNLQFGFQPLLILIASVLIHINPINSDPGDAYGLITKIQTECEFEGIMVGSKLADSYNAYDEVTDHDSRIHNDYLVEHLGFSEWISRGVGGDSQLTAMDKPTVPLRERGGWGAVAHRQLSNSSYWSLENKWIYLLGDATLRQVWASFASALSGTAAGEMDHNSHEWLRSNCVQQQQSMSQQRVNHPTSEHSAQEVTCYAPGFGPRGKITFDWKQYPFEAYDEWLFGEDGVWNKDPEIRRPDVLVIQTGTHTCMHAIRSPKSQINETMIAQHTRDVKVLIKRARAAVRRPRNSSSASNGSSGGGSGSSSISGSSDSNSDSASSSSSGGEGQQAMQQLIIVTASRVLNGDPRSDRCTWRMNRIIAREAHVRGLPVLEREEIEHRLMFKTENAPLAAKVIKAEAVHMAAVAAGGGPATTASDGGGIKSSMHSSSGGSSNHVTTTATAPTDSSSSVGQHFVHGSRISGEFHLPKPCPQVVATSLLAMISCLARNGTRREEFPPLKQQLLQATAVTTTTATAVAVNVPELQQQEQTVAGAGPELTSATTAK